jgi:uncharacterized cysteine cluster protein YcgN (CxxCxxCC family)
MDSKYCSSCLHKHVLSSFLKDTSSDLGSKIFSTCIPCRAKNSKKRKALQPLCPNVPPKRRPKLSVLPTSRPIRPLLIPRPLTSALPPLLDGDPGPTVPPPPPESRTRPSLPPVQPRVQRQPILPVYPPPIQSIQLQAVLPVQPQPRVPQPVLPVQHHAHPHAAGFLPTEQRGYIQSFNAAMDQVKMETCSRCKERWFAMDLKGDVCDACFLRDKGSKTPFLMSAENGMDPGDVPAYLPELTQVEEMIIARSHVQMMVHRYRGRQYHYSGHCVSFMQNTIKTVDVLPNQCCQ